MDIPRLLGKYELRGALGSGAMGIVYQGWDPVIARQVAIKTVKLPEHHDPAAEEGIARFRREAQAAGRLTHPNIVAVHDYGETSDVAYIVMEYVDGSALKSLLDKQERFALPDIRRIMEDLLAGLQFSHDRGVVHRDIKPANLMLNSERRCKIADFGIARIENSNMTQAGTVLGTPAYMSPEQFRGEPVDARTDIYSSGVLLYQLLTGERPFDGSVTSIMHKVLNVEPPAPSQFAALAPKELDQVVLRAMAKRPEDRFPSARAFATALARAIDTSASRNAEVDATVVALRAPGARHGSAIPAIWVGLGVATVAVLVGGGATWWMLFRTSRVHDIQSTSTVPGIGRAVPPPRPSRPVLKPMPVPGSASKPAPVTPAPARAATPALARGPISVSAPGPAPASPLQRAPPRPGERPPQPSRDAILGTGGSSPVQNPGAIEMALHLSLAQRQAVQVSLQALGYDTGGRDGDFGPRTRAAIAEFQLRHRMEPNGFLTSEIVRMLLRDASVTAHPVAAVATQGHAPVPMPARSRVAPGAVACQLPPDGHTEKLSPAMCRQRGGLLD
jgi:serine/threonine-protein kinase